MSRAPILAVRDLTAPLGTDGTPALPGVDFAVSAGERVLLTGPSGSGKSTLLRAMVLLEPAEGSVLLDGEEVGPERVRELRRRIGYVPQRPASLAATIEENLAFPRSLGADVLDADAQDTLLERVEEDDGRALVWVSHQTDPVRELATRRVSLGELKG